MAGLTAQRYAALRGPMLWLALMRGVGIRAAIPALLLLSAVRWLARPRSPAGGRGARAGTAARDGRGAPSQRRDVSGQH